MKLFLQKNAKFSEPRAFGGWGLRPQTPKTAPHCEFLATPLGSSVLPTRFDQKKLIEKHRHVLLSRKTGVFEFTEGSNMHTSMQATILLAITCSLLLESVFCDVYLHSPRGSNNRLNEKSATRNNNNRLFNSQVRILKSYFYF